MTSSRFSQSSIGQKIIMAVTGILLVLFVLIHMLGNLQLYANDGGQALNAYAQMLHDLAGGYGIWIARGGLLLLVALHIWSALQLTLMNRRARPIDYEQHAYKESTWAGRGMRISGIIVAIFIVFHLLHLTAGKIILPALNIPLLADGGMNVFANVVQSFQIKWVAGFYIASMLALAPHLAHGIWSLLQTLGLSHPNFNATRKLIAGLLTALIILANISFPIAVQLKHVTLPSSLVSSR
jgi:succinate dehydrogenase / fumarate reductase cytochrome b subunit